MKNRFTALALSLLSASFLFGQTSPELVSSGGGAFVPERSECLSPAQRATIAAKLAANEQQLLQEGKIAPAAERSVLSFDWPLRAAPDLDWNNFVILVNFVDQLQSNSGVLDYDCGTRTYDGHLGTDISTWPFPWHLKTNNLVEVVAAESGVIIGKEDGNSDENCSWGTGQYWNAVYIRHDDGSVSWYGHMKKFSLTNKPVGASVNKGEYLGILASSGYSTGPHLHFEVYRQQPYQFSNLIDPYAGECNFINPDSWWANQQPYRKPTLNTLLTHDAVPEHGCPSGNEDPHFSNHFTPGGGPVYTAVYFRDEQQGQTSAMRLRKPNGTIGYSWSHTAPETFSGSWWYWSWNLPNGGPYGTWKFEVDFNGETFVHEFLYGNASSTDSENEQSGISIYPNPSAGALTVQSAEEGNALLQIFDSVGRLRYSGQAQLNQEINLAGYETGVYFVRVQRDDEAHLFRIVRE